MRAGSKTAVSLTSSFDRHKAKLQFTAPWEAEIKISETLRTSKEAPYYDLCICSIFPRLNTALLRNLVECLTVSHFRPKSVVLVSLLILPSWGCIRQKEGSYQGSSAGCSKIEDHSRHSSLTSALSRVCWSPWLVRASSLHWLLKHLFHSKGWFYLIISMLKMLWPPFYFICFTKNWKLKISMQNWKLLDFCDFLSLAYPQPYS